MNEGQTSFGGQSGGLGGHPVAPYGQPEAPDGQSVVTSGQPVLPGGQAIGKQVVDGQMVGGQPTTIGGQSVISNDESMKMRQLAVPMAQQPMTHQTIMSGSGDVVLSTGGEKKGGRKKWIVVLAILAVVALLIGIGVWIKIKEDENGRITEIRNSFNMFANYVIDGEARTTKIDSDFNQSLKYYIMDGDMSMYERSGELFDNFVALYNDNSDADKITKYPAILGNAINSEQQLIESLKELYANKKANQKAINDKTDNLVLIVFEINALINDGDVSEYVAMPGADDE